MNFLCFLFLEKSKFYPEFSSTKYIQVNLAAEKTSPFQKMTSPLKTLIGPLDTPCITKSLNCVLALLILNQSVCSCYVPLLLLFLEQ